MKRCDYYVSASGAVFGKINFDGLSQQRGKEEYLHSAIYTTHILKALRHGSQFYLLSFVSVHQMAQPLTKVADIQLQFTTQLSTPKG